MHVYFYKVAGIQSRLSTSAKTDSNNLISRNSGMLSTGFAAIQNELLLKDTLMQIQKSPYVFVFI